MQHIPNKLRNGEEITESKRNKLILDNNNLADSYLEQRPNYTTKSIRDLLMSPSFKEDEEGGGKKPVP